MSVEEICRLDVASVAADDCVLFLWATFPQLQEALQVIKAWDFKYKTVAFVWLKQNKSGKGWFFGLGFWTRGNAELCLLATRGKPRRKSNRVHQFIISPLRQHSQKPSEAREKIVELMGELPRLELFAREKADGWDTWGNEVACDVVINSRPETTGGGFPACWFGAEYPKATYHAIWQKQNGIYHPTVKSVEFLSWLIQISSTPKELVFDGFMGTGSTALAALRNSRDYLGLV